MGRKKVYAQDPGPENDEMPYDFWVFIRWCVNREELTESTAKVYVSNIRTAFKTMFADEDALFKNIRNAFYSHTREPERRSYCRFIRWRIDIERRSYGMKVEIKADPSYFFLETPLSNWFRIYMKGKGKGYTPTTINTYCCKMKRLYNLQVRRVQRKDVFDYLAHWLEEARMSGLF